MELTLKERLFLANQYETLIKLSDEENAETYEKALEIVEKGYTNLYDELFSAVSKNNLSIGECKLVESILELYNLLEITLPRYLQLFQNMILNLKGLTAICLKITQLMQNF